jgi:uncharacterized membrane protein (DUF2068 family)
MRSRPSTVTVAAVALGILSFANLPLGGFLSLPITEVLTMGGMAAVFFYGFLVLGIAGLVAAAGLWMLKKWGIWLAIIVCVIYLLENVQWIFAPDAVLLDGVAVLFYALIIVLVLLPSSRRAFTASS